MQLFLLILVPTRDKGGSIGTLRATYAFDVS